MPAEAPPAPPPSAPAAPAPAPPPAATDAGPGNEIRVTPGTVDKGPKQDPPKKGSAMDRLMTDLRAKAKPQFFESAPDTAPAQAAEAPDKATIQPASGDSPPQGSGDQLKSPAPSPAEPDKKKTNPWKLVDEYKSRASKAESDLLEFRKQGVDPALKKSFEEEVSKLKSQNEELEKHIRFVDYQKSSEFRTKYVEPYEKAWTRAVKEISEVQVTDPASGERRAATVNDLAEVFNLPLSQARDLADERFGKFADDVMGYRKEIQQLFEAQNTALKDAKDNSIKRDKERQEQIERFQSHTAGEIKALWDKANAEFAERKDLSFLFKPPDTDEDHKKRLASGYALVDKAFATNSTDPNLTPEQRAEAVKMHAAVRMRAAAFGPLRAKYDASQARIAELEKELAQYKETVPPIGGTSGPDGQPPKRASGWDNIRAGLQKIAKPG